MEVDADLKSLLAEQQRELTAAQETDADLFYAYQLQLHEAINASLILNDAAASKDSPNVDPLDVAVPEPPSATEHHVLAEELSNYEQQLLDREKSLAELKLLQDDLRRSIHDHAFAREILSVPEEKWRRTGDYIKKPFGEGSSSESTATDEELSTFRVYFKGSVSEEIVGGERKVLSGIGIAICDPGDALVFEMSKGLIPNANENEMMNAEIVEVKALIEGLDVALMLGLKRVNVYSDNNAIIRYATRQQPRPEQGNLATLLEQVSLLARKFTPCQGYFVEPDRLKFAVKRARDAIMAQVRHVNKGEGMGMVETCAICLEETYVDRMLSVDGCLHRYCFSCMKKYAEVKLLQGMLLPKCPHEGCKSELKIDSCKKFLAPELFDLMSQRLKEASIPVHEKIYCPYPRCSALMSKAEVQVFASSSRGGDSGVRTCTKCRGLFCINCKVPWHSNLTCFDYKRSNPHPSGEDAKLKSLANRNRWRPCPKCNHMVSLAQGCYHIYCRCGHEFCYTCGAQWVNKKATCKCPIWDERNIIYDHNRPQRRRN